MEFGPTFTPTPEKEKEIEKEEKSGRKEIKEICKQIRDEDLGMEIHTDNAEGLIEIIDNYPEYQKYLDQKVTIGTLREIVSKVEEEAEKRNDDELEYIGEFLREETEVIKKKTRKYYEIINSLENGSDVARFSGPEKLKKWTETKDKKRRICHNRIVSELGIFKRYLNQRLPKEFNINLDVDFFDEEELPSGLLENVSDYKNLSGEEKERRQKIGEWAFTTGIGEKLDEYKKLAQQIKKRSS